MRNPVIGIDLGTTSTCAAWHDGKNARVLSAGRGYAITPSYFAVSEKRQVLSAHAAKAQAVLNPAGTVTAFKRLIGQSFQSAQTAAVTVNIPNEVVAGPRGQAVFRLHGRTVSPVEMTTCILREVAASAAEALGTPITRAIVTVPASYNEVQRQDTFVAVKMAGLDPIRLLNEPTAAALAYLAQKPMHKGILAIYDLGGGTFDVTILAIQDGVFEVLASCGDLFLGGVDFDAVIVARWIEGLRQQHGAVFDEAHVLARLRQAAENAKITLSSELVASVQLPFLAKRGDSPIHFSTTMSRPFVTQFTRELVERTFNICSEAFRLAGLRPEQIDDVVLIGGMTRMPAVQTAVGKFFGRLPAKGIHPEEAVAMGAAHYAHSLESRQQGPILIDALPHTLSVAMGDICMPLLTKGCRLPARHVESFSTVRDNQTSFKLRVMQGESKSAGQNTILGVYEIMGLQPKPRGAVNIRVEFSVGAGGQLSVRAGDSASRSLLDVQVSEELRQVGLGVCDGMAAVK